MGGGGTGNKKTRALLLGINPEDYREFRLTGSIAELYDLGLEVMPSTHSYMRVVFAVRKFDSQDVVIKIRYKPACFRSREDERSWRTNTEFLLNLPESIGVAKLYDVVEDPKAFYVVMERVSGMDLFETLEAERRVPVPVVRDMMRQLLRSLAHLHSHNAVHKDLKLENVMLGSSSSADKSAGKGAAPEGQNIKVIDFDTIEEWTPGAPPSKDVVGTDQYISQEAYSGKYSPLSDIFAVGVMIYRMLTGKFPFHDGMFDDEAGENWVGGPKMEQIRKRLRCTKVDFSMPVFRDNPDACDLVTRMLSYTQDSRPTAASALEHPWFQEVRVISKKGSAKREVTEAEEQNYCLDDLVDDGIIIGQ